MPTVPRDYEIKYGTYTVGGTTDNLIDSYHTVERDYITSAVEFSFIITAASTSAFATACKNAESAFRKPRQDLEVKVAGSSILALKQSDSTGLDADPKIVKEESLADTAISRRYTVRIDFGQPADNLGLNGLRSSAVDVAQSPNRRRTLTISGIYTAINAADGGDPQAYDQYKAQIDTFVTGELAYLDSTAIWELVEEPVAEYNSTNKVVEFSRTYKEFFYPDVGKTSAIMDDVDIIAQTIKITRTKNFPGDTPNDSAPPPNQPQNNDVAPQASGKDAAIGQGGGSQSSGQGTQNQTTSDPGRSLEPVVRPTKLTITFEAWIKKGVDMKNKWSTVIRPGLLADLTDVSDGTTTRALVDESPEFDLTDNKITAKLELFEIGQSRILEQKITKGAPVDVTFGYVPVPAWDGNRYSKYVYQGPAVRQSSLDIYRRVLGDPRTDDYGPQNLGLTN